MQGSISYGQTVGDFHGVTGKAPNVTMLQFFARLSEQLAAL